MHLDAKFLFPRNLIVRRALLTRISICLRRAASGHAPREGLRGLHDGAARSKKDGGRLHLPVGSD